VMEDLGEISYKVGDDGPVMTGDVKLIEEVDGGVKIGSKVDNIIRGVTREGFDASFEATAELKEQAWVLFKDEKWSELEELFNVNNLNDGWPPNYGFRNITHTKTGDELEGLVFDRFQNTSSLSGRYASPVQSGEGIDDLVFTYDSRALKDQITEGTFYIKFKLTALPTNLKFQYGEAVPWFDNLGSADQIKSSINFADLEADINYIILEKLQFQSNNWVTIP